MLTRTRVLLTALLLGLAPAVAQSQAYPTKPVVFVVPFASGGGMDSLSRAITQRLSLLWEQPVLVDFRPGANGIIGTDYVVRAVPDGYTLLVSSGGLLLNAVLFNKLPYDPAKDLAAVAGLVQHPFGLAVGPSIPITSMKELIELAKSKPGAVSYATFGIGSSAHLVME